MYQTLYSSKNPLITLFVTFQVILTPKMIFYIKPLDIWNRYFLSETKILKTTFPRLLHISTNMF